MLKGRYDGVMYRKELKVVSVAVIVLSVLVAFTLSASAANPTADKIGVDDANGYKNTMVSVPVNITNPRDGPIFSMEFNISYDKSVINVTDIDNDIQNGNLTSEGWYDPGIVSHGGETLEIELRHNESMNDTYAIQNGINGSVVVLNFSVLGEPGETSHVNLSEIYIYNESSGWSTPPPQNGTFTVGGAQAWYLHNDTRMYKGNMSKPADTVTITDDSTTNWTANEAATVDVKFPAGNWTGWLTLNTPFTAAENFTVAVGSYNTTTSVFSSAGTQKFIGDGSAKAFLDIPAAEFTVPKGNNLSLQVSNPSTTLVIKTGAGNSFITSPETDPGYPVPELSITILFSVGILALAAYILRPRFLKR